MIKRRTAEDWAIDSVVMTVMILVIIVTLYPFYYVTILAFNDGVDASAGGIYFWPRTPTLENFNSLLKEPSWLNSIFISISRTVLGTVFGLLFTSIISYALSFDHVLGRKIYFRIYIFTMYFSGGMIPFYILLRSINLLNTFWVYVIPGMLDIYYMLILINFYKKLPESLFESARLDGAGDFRVFFQIALPLSKASLATVALFFAVGQWNSWLDAVYYVQRKELRPLAYLMMDIINRSAAMSRVTDATTLGYASQAMSTTTSSLQMAAMVTAVFPILAVYPFLQKYFVKGVMIGSIKE